MNLNQIKIKIFRFFINITAIIYLVFDETFVFIYNNIAKSLAKFPSLEMIKEYWRIKISEMNKYVVLVFLLSHLVVSELLGILSFMLLAKGLIIPFVTLYIVKFFPFFLMKFVFNCAKEELLTIGWFNYCYIKTVQFTDYLKETEIVVKVKEYKDSVLKNVSKIKDLIKF